jgi:hypothetical protein
VSDPCDRLRAKLAELTAERDALRAELALAKPVFSRRQLEARLTELREAAERVCEDYPSQTHGLRINTLRAVLAKLKP